MNKIGPTLELCGATDAIFSHELQKYFAFLAFCFLNGLYSKATLPCLIVRGSEIAEMGFTNLSKSLPFKEEGFFK